MSERTVNVFLFEGFELLDVAGPVELLHQVRPDIVVQLVATAPGPVASAQDVELVAPTGLQEATPDIVLVPGGRGTRVLVGDAGFLARLRAWAGAAQIVTSVCTGSAVLAAAGLLDGYRATSNKRAFTWAASHGADVTWVPQARWVHDRDRWTSSGVAAGMDMTAALIAHLLDPDAAHRAAATIELELHTDPAWDPFAEATGLLE